MYVIVLKLKRENGNEREEYHTMGLHSALMLSMLYWQCLILRVGCTTASPGSWVLS